MRKADIKLGHTYVAKISGRLCHVRIDTVRGDGVKHEARGWIGQGGWNATNLDTGRTVVIKTAAKLRREVK